MKLEPASRTIRWGVLGFAKIAREQLIPAIERSEGSELAAIGTTDAAKWEDCRKRFPGTTVYRDYLDVLRDPTVDAVYIPLPNSLHREWTIRAAEHGKHVLCEKPIA